MASPGGQNHHLWANLVDLWFRVNGQKFDASVVFYALRRVDGVVSCEPALWTLREIMRDCGCFYPVERGSPQMNR